MTAEAIRYTNETIPVQLSHGKDAEVIDLTARRGPDHPFILARGEHGATYSEIGPDGRYKTTLADNSDRSHLTTAENLCRQSQK